MGFRRDLAAATLMKVAAALHAGWSQVSEDVQEQLRRLIDEYGHAIYTNNPPNRVTPMLRLLDGIAALPASLSPSPTRLRAGLGSRALPS